MKLKPRLIFILLLFSCVYDPPQKGKEILIHNQTNKPIIILDSLTVDRMGLYDTATVNGRKYISRQANYMTEYGVYRKFYSDLELTNFKSNRLSDIKIYFLDSSDLQNILNQTPFKHSFRSFDINIDTINKYDLNHLFIMRDTVLFEHDYSYYIN